MCDIIGIYNSNKTLRISWWHQTLYYSEPKIVNKPLVKTSIPFFLQAYITAYEPISQSTLLLTQ